MSLQIARDGITKMRVDAIVNAANGGSPGGSGVGGTIHETAIPLLHSLLFHREWARENVCRSPDISRSYQLIKGCRNADAVSVGAYNKYSLIFL